MRIAHFLFYFLVLASQALATDIRVAETDYRAYRSLTLPSGLDVLLVHDKRAAKAAAAVALPVGSLENPDSQPGLAHYLEHMLFLGSGSYPGPEEYQTFISQNGGKTNAGTGYTSTTYMMEVDPLAFAQALHRMADTLANPRLDPVYADKERQAVNAEMESKKYSDGRRLAMLSLSTLNPDHPATRFTGGNLETLSDKPGSLLHEELVRFHQTWYSANLMKAALYGPQTLDELEALARKELAVIPDRRAQIKVPDAVPSTAAEQGILLGIRPVHDARSLSIDFVLPQDLDNISTKPLQVVAAVLGTETDHSLVDVLRAKGWVLGLSAGGDTTTLRNGVIFSLSLQLTEKGYAQHEAVLGTVFAYLDQLRQRGITQPYFAQLKTMLDMEFRFAPQVSGFDYVAQAATKMLRYPIQDVNYGDFRLDSFDQDAIKTMLDTLVPENARIFVVGPDQDTDQEAYFYQTPYNARAITATDTARWAELALSHLRLPELNAFVPDDFSLVAGLSSKPRQILNQPGLSVWQAGSRFHHEPKAILMVRLQSAYFSSTLEQAAMQGVLLELWTQSQAGLKYQAQEAGLGLGLSGDEGVVVTISGFGQHQPDLLAKVLEFLCQPLLPQDFEQARAERLRALDNVKKQGLFGQAMGATYSLLKIPAWDETELEKATQVITLDKLAAYVRALRQDLRCTVFGFGNMPKDRLLAVAEAITPYLGAQAGLPPLATRIAPKAGVLADYRKDSELEDSALIQVFLDPRPGPQATAQMLLLRELLSTRFYTQLRTEEQLGYVVASFPLMFAHCAGIGFGVQSPVRGTAGLAERFGSFYFRALRQLRSTSSGEFTRVRQGVLASLTEIPDTLGEEFGRLETDLRLGNPAFDSRSKLVRAVEGVTLAEVIRAYEVLVLGPGSTRVMVQVQGSRFSDTWVDPAGSKRISRPADFHSLMGVQQYQGL